MSVAGSAATLPTRQKKKKAKLARKKAKRNEPMSKFLLGQRQSRWGRGRGAEPSSPASC